MSEEHAPRDDFMCMDPNVRSALFRVVFSDCMFFESDAGDPCFQQSLWDYAGIVGDTQTVSERLEELYRPGYLS